MSLFLDDGDVRLYHGDALSVLQTLEDASVHMCVTSPPFYGLRDYGTGRWEGGDPDCDHLQPPIVVPGRQGNAYGTPPGARKERAGHYGHECGKCGAQRVDQQIGLEETPEQWVDSLVAVFREVRRVLRDDGTLWLEVGDSYNSAASNQQRGAETSTLQGLAPESGLGRRPIVTGCKPKDLIGAPWQLAFALRADGWWLRSDIVWVRPNPMPESVTDRPTKSHSYIFLLAKLPRYFFDQEAVREPHNGQASGNLERFVPPPGHEITNDHRGRSVPWEPGEGGRNIRSVWTIPTQPRPEAHFATFPEELARRCILAGTSERGCCPECGAPWVREVEWEFVGQKNTSRGEQEQVVHRPGVSHDLYAIPRQTKDWVPSCAHRGTAGATATPSVEPGDPAAVPCVVLDPFVGSGTVPHVARKHGRHAIGIDLSSSYLELAARRLQQLSLFA